VDRLEFDRSLLTDFYNSRGYPDFRVLDITSELSRERDATFVTFVVQEGLQYRFGEVGIASSVPGLDVEAFRNRIRVRPGSTWSPAPIDSSIRRMETLTVQQGLDFIRIEPQLTRNERAQTVDVTFVISRGPRVFVERIDIEGNATTLDRVIRQQFRVVEGDPFNPREIERASDRIRALGYFESADVETRQGSAPDQVLVDVNVVEQPTGSLSFGASYSVDNGIGFIIGFSERNFLGRGQTLSFDLQAGTQDSSSQITFIEPFFLGRDLRFRFTAFYEESDFDNVSYNTRRIGFTPNFTFPLNDTSRLSLGYELSKDTISNVAEGSSPILFREEGSRHQRGVLPSDLRQPHHRPQSQRGGPADLRAGVRGPRRGQPYVKHHGARDRVTRDVFNDDVTLSASPRGRGAEHASTEVSRVTDRFFMSNSPCAASSSAGWSARHLRRERRRRLAATSTSSSGSRRSSPSACPRNTG
jgi:outer membrane protein insertion porin family